MSHPQACRPYRDGQAFAGRISSERDARLLGDILEDLRQQRGSVSHRPRLARVAEEAEGTFHRPSPEAGRALAPPDPIVGAAALTDHSLDQIFEPGVDHPGPPPGLDSALR